MGLAEVIPWRRTALSFFFAFGALTSGLAAVMLQLPGTLLDTLPRLNPRAHDGFANIGSMAVRLMAAVCVACAIA